LSKKTTYEPAPLTDALEIITRMADAIRTPDIRERFIALSRSDLSPPASA
jgi:hypothetical protein